jgi:exoribonuclease II
MELENRIIDFLGSSEMVLAVVLRQSHGKLQVQLEGGRSDRAAERQIVAVHGAAGADPTRALRLLAERIQASMADIDVELLWESLLDHSGPLAISTMSRQYFGDAEPLHLSALARCLAADPVHFRRKGLEFSVRTREEAAEVEELRRRRAMRAQVREQSQAWLRALLASPERGPISVPEELQDFVRQARDFLLLGHNSEAVNTLSDVAGSRRTAREVALDLVTRTGNLPADADPFLLVNGVHAGFSAAVLEYAEGLAPYAADSSRSDYTTVETFSIDDDETREVDDALSVERQGDRTTVGIHIADPAHFVAKDDVLDRVAVERPLSLYLPTTTVLMFPERLGCDLASLSAGRLRATLSFRVTFGPDGTLEDWEFAGGQIRVSRRLSYEQADALLRAPEGTLGEALTRLLRISETLAAARAAAGGVTLSRPDPIVHVSGDRVTVRVADPNSPSRRLVSEMMVLANRLTAEYALRHDVPVIYRVQDPPSEPVQSLTCYDPVEFERQVRKLKRTRLSTIPQPHAGLGLDLYAQISSPIRRYADLVLARQLDARVEGREFPYSQTELLEVLGAVERMSQQNRALEREARRRWLLEYVRQQKMTEELEAVVVSRDGRFVLAELDGICERGVLFTVGTVQVGQRVRVRVRDVHPQEGKMALEMSR